MKARALFAATLAAVLVIAGSLFAPRPIGASWREADTLAIAANLRSDGFDVLHPRVDWRGDTDGAVECEFPAYQALAATMLDDERSPAPARWLALLALGAAAALLFVLLERRLGSWPAWFGAGAFVAGGQFAFLAARVMPDAFSLLFGLLALLATVRWLDADRARWLVLAAAAAAVAALAKPTTLPLWALAGAWTCLHEPARLRRVSTWIAFGLPVLALAAWMLHAHHLGASTGLTFGVTFGDTKAPHLDHLLRPGLHKALAETTLAVGIGPFGALALVWLVLRRRLRRADAAVLAVTVLGLYGSLRYSHSAAMGPQYHLVAAVAGAWFFARAVPQQPRPWLVVLFTLALGASAAWHFTAEARVRNESENAPTTALGAELATLVPPGERLVVRGAKPRVDTFWRRPNNFEEPVLFHLARRQGWALPGDGADPTTLADLRQRGAGWFVDGNPASLEPATRQWLEGHGDVLIDREHALVVRLRPVPRRTVR